MSILDTKSRSGRKRLKRTVLTTLLISLFIVLFSLIYEYFSHGVQSLPMICAFLYLLVGGTGVFLFFLLVPVRYTPGSLPRQIWFCGLAALTVGSIMKGVIEIYGTTNRLTEVYPVAGYALLAFGAAVYILGLIFLKRVK